MDITEIRRKALNYLNRHQATMKKYQAEWTLHVMQHGEGTDQQILFAEDPKVRAILEDQVMYERWGLLYATAAVMEMNWEARKLFHDSTKEMEKGSA